MSLECVCDGGSVTTMNMYVVYKREINLFPSFTR